MSVFPARGLYAIADTGWIGPDRFIAAVRGAIEGGAAAVQLRDKQEMLNPDARLLNDLLIVCRKHAVPLIINDNPVLAAKVGADGVHVGQTDHSAGPDVKIIRSLLGPHAVIGVSCHNDLDSALAAVAGGADYVAFGRFFASQTKPDAPAASLETLRTARRLLDVPIVAIGGITPDNGARLLEAGADWLAVIAGIFAQPDPRAAAAQYRTLIRQHLNRQGL